MRLNNHGRPITNLSKQPYPANYQKETKVKRKEKVEEEEEEYGIFYLRTPLISVTNFDCYDSGGRRDGGGGVHLALAKNLGRGELAPSSSTPRTSGRSTQVSFSNIQYPLATNNCRNF